MPQGNKAILVAAVCLVAGLLSTAPVAADAADGAGTGGIRAELAERLSEDQLRAYIDWRKAKGAFDRRLEAYWKEVNERRDGRKQKHAAGTAYAAEDYVTTQPPKYAGPELPAAVAKVLAELQAKPAEPEKERTTVADFLAAAKQLYGFAPAHLREADFKRRYAAEALAAGLSKDQVVRVYALETGGIGTYDMQAGIHPVTRAGKPISSALGYAQLLHANSVNELVKHGDGFVRRLTQMAAAPGVGRQRAAELKAKAAVVARTLRTARSVPNEWSQHVKLGGAPHGSAIHTLNLDGDIGPWLQVLKLKGLLETAAKEAKRTSLSGAELELMNLAGPRTGLEMMQPIARGMPTSNFFSQQGYYRNSIVRDRTAAELLAALEERMAQNIKKPGSVEFAAMFDALQSPGRKVAATPSGSQATALPRAAVPVVRAATSK